MKLRDRPRSERGLLAALRDRVAARKKDRGAALVIVLVVSLVLVGVTGVAMTSTDSSLALTAGGVNLSAAEETAFSGLSVATAAMGAAEDIEDLPCGESGANSVATGGPYSYTVTITYYRDGTVSGECGPGVDSYGSNTPPTSAALVSQATGLHGESAEMGEQVSIDAVDHLYSAFDYAMFSPGAVDLTVAVTTQDAPGTTTPPSIYGGTFPECTDGTTIGGSAVTSGTSVDINSSCTIDGGLYVNGNISITNKATIGGDVYAYGGSVNLTSSPDIKGNVYAIGTPAGAGGTITTNNDPVTIGGNLYATGLITAVSPPASVGTEYPYDTAISGETMAPPPTFPQLDPTPSDYNGIGEPTATIIGIGGPGEESCTDFFTPQYLAPSYTASVQFVETVNQATTPTVIYAPSCPVPGIGYLTPTFSLSTNITLIVGSFDLGGGTTAFQSSSSSLSHDLSVIVPYGTSCSSRATPDGAINMTNTNTFTPQVVTFFYTPCTMSFSVSPTLYGVLDAGGGITATNSFMLNYTTQAAAGVPGTEGRPVPVVTVNSKNLLRA